MQFAVQTLDGLSGILTVKLSGRIELKPTF
jgi:hypothetical protein